MGRERGLALSTGTSTSTRTGTGTVLVRRVPRGLAAAALVVGGLLALALSVGVAVTLGPADVSLVNVRDILLNHLGLASVPVRAAEDAIVWQERLPRALVAAACGAGLGVCGVILQSLLRNPLADPFVLGVSSGASTGAVLVGVLGVGGGVVGLSGGAFVGALVAFGFVLLLTRFSAGGTSGVILAGVASTQLFSALTSLIVFALADSDETRGVMFWLLGSVVCLAAARTLDAFAFGEDVAASLGVHVGRTRLLLLVVTALLTATLVSIAGAIGFVGLVLPHAARLVFGQRHSRVIPATILLGAVFLVWVDAGSRVAFAPTPLPVGVGTALVGVPVFMLLLLRRRGRS